MQHRDCHAAQLLPRVRFQSRPAPFPVTEPGVARGLRQRRPVRRDDGEPQSQKRVDDTVEAALARRRTAPERNLPAHEVHLHEGGQRPRQARRRLAEPARDLAEAVGAGADDVQQRPQRGGRRHFGPEQTLRFVVQRAGGIKDQSVDRGVEVAAVRLGQLPVARHAAPDRVAGDQVAGRFRGEDLGQVPRPQRAYRERFHGAPVQRSAGAQHRAVHHAQARPAHHQAGPRRRVVQPVLQDCRQRRVGGNQIRQLVQDERSRPPRVRGGGGKAAEE